VTREQLELYEHPHPPPERQRALADGLATRRTGLSHLVQALSRRYGFLTQSRPAPITVITPVLAAAQERSALPALLERFHDHETPASALPSLANAIAALGDAASGSSLLAWLRLYRNDSSLRDTPEVITAVASATVRLLGEPGRQELRAMLADGRASEAIEQALSPLLLEEPQAVAQGAPGPRPTTTAAAAVVLPRSLSQGAIDAAFAAHARELRLCTDQELTRNPKLTQVRIAFVVEGDGSAHAFQFAPATTELIDCLYPVVANVSLPAFAQERAVARTVLDPRPTTPPVVSATESSAPAAENWWSWRVRSAPASASASSVPWWRSQHRFAPRIEPTEELESAKPPPVAPAPVAPAPVAVPVAAPAAAAPASPEVDAWWLPATSEPAEPAEPTAPGDN
jgi:hypothetical protein